MRYWHALIAILFTATIAVGANAPMYWADNNYGKMLTARGFKLIDDKEFRTLSVDPTTSSGVAAGIGSLGLRNSSGVGQLWLKIGSGDTAWQSLTQDWKLTGNASTTAGTNFLGTTDGVDLVFKTNGTEQLRLVTGAEVKSTSILGIPAGSLGAPSLFFNGDSNSGLYRVAADQAALVAGGKAGIEWRLATSGTYANLGVGGAASLSDNYPFLAQRDEAAPIVLQASNPNTGAGSGVKWQMASSLGNNGGEMGLFSPATAAPDAYTGGNMTLRSTGTTAGIAYVADDSGAYHKFYVGGNAVGQKIATINSSGITAHVGAFIGALTGNVTGNLTGNVTGNVSGTSGSTTGNAATATALAANGSNCSAGQFPLGVDASGAVESCTALPTTIAGTANQITASASTGAITLSIPSSPTLPGTTTGTFSGNLTGAVTGNASTATALAANGANCSAGSYPLGVDASGAAESCAAANTAMTVTKATAAATNVTYTTPANVLYLRIRLAAGGGGGGSANATNNGNAGSNGAQSCFGTNATACTSPIIQANSGSGGCGSVAGGGGGSAGGSATVSSPAVELIAMTGGPGGGSMNSSSSTSYTAGGMGGTNFFGGGGGPGAPNAGGLGATGYGAGGGGAGGPSSSGSTSGCGGSAGGAAEAIITSPAATYYYTVGAGGAGGTSTWTGGDGKPGAIIIQEFYK